MRLLVFFDLPVKTKKDRKAYTKFRKLLLDNGFVMLQFSVYVRICLGDDMAQAHEAHIQRHLPPRGHVRTLMITNKQYERMKILLGNETSEEKIGWTQLVLF